jgi:hypothetical protein
MKLAITLPLGLVLCLALPAIAKSPVEEGRDVLNHLKARSVALSAVLAQVPVDLSGLETRAQAPDYHKVPFDDLRKALDSCLNSAVSLAKKPKLSGVKDADLAGSFGKESGSGAAVASALKDVVAMVDPCDAKGFTDLAGKAGGGAGTFVQAKAASLVTLRAYLKHGLGTLVDETIALANEAPDRIAGLKARLGKSPKPADVKALDDLVAESRTAADRVRADLLGAKDKGATWLERTRTAIQQVHFAPAQ